MLPSPARDEHEVREASIGSLRRRTPRAAVYDPPFLPLGGEGRAGNERSRIPGKKKCDLPEPGRFERRRLPRTQCAAVRRPPPLVYTRSAAINLLPPPK
ncbi:hypothetical protein MRX96_005265 [Rhipicephalus microplus]